MTVDPNIFMTSLDNLFYIGRGYRRPWQDVQKLFRKVFVNIMLNFEKKVSYILI